LPVLPRRTRLAGDAVVSAAEPIGALARLGQYTGFAPAIALFGVFFAAPLVLIVAYSFWTVVNYNVVQHWTFGNYTYFFSVPTYVATLWDTLWVAAVTTVLALLAAFPLAYWLARYVRASLRRPLLLMIILPFWTSYLLRVTSWTTILGEQGVLNRLLEAIGIIHAPLSFLLYNRPAVILVLVYLYFPFVALTLYATLERFDWSQLRAAMDLGATPRVALTRILLPQIRPGITTAVIFVFIPVIGEYLTPQLVGGTRGVMIGNLIVNFFQGAEYTRGAAVALLIAVLIVGLLIAFRKQLDVRGSYAR
jgi:ABC-type spermidine/putrescine transport system permease subunit I